MRGWTVSAATGRQLAAGGDAPYRADIDGLRALAILLVVIYHVWLGRVSGGVDVFLMISAFFLTTSFVRRLQSGNRLAVPTYWLRKFRRLLPAAVLTLLGILAAAFLVYPASAWPALWRQTWTSLFYVQNWELAFSNVDYYAREEVVPSPLQHFWSLSIQGQVFIVWPLIFLLVAFIARRARVRAEPLLAVAFGLVFVASLAFSISETASQQSFAYFDSRTRLWEFAAGSLLALGLPLLSVPAAVRAVLGWLGIAGILTCGIVLDVEGGFPGYLALWPVLCTAAVIVAGAGPSRGGPAALLASRPLRFLGRDAYALYLVHWPILITWLIVADRTSVGWLAGSAIIVLSLVVARIVSWAVENPIRRIPKLDAKPLLGGLVLAACVGAVAIPLWSWQTVERLRVDAILAQFPAEYPGASALLPGAPVVPSGVPIMPSATTLADEWVSFDGQCAGEFAPRDLTLEGTCMQSLATGELNGTIVIAGDSHAQQWGGAVVPLAAAQGWNTIALLKGGCALAVGEESKGPADCPEWRDAVFSYIDDLAPAFVFGMATKTIPDEPSERMLRGLETTIERLSATSAAIVLFRDNPRFVDDMFRCAETNGASSDVCVRPRSSVLADSNPAAAVADSVVMVDLSDFLCPDGACPAVIGNVAVYLDHDHLSRSYAETLSPMLVERMRATGVLG